MYRDHFSLIRLLVDLQIRFKYEFVNPEALAAEAPPPPTEPTHEEKMQQQLAEQLQLPGLDTSAPLPRQPPMQHAKVGAIGTIIAAAIVCLDNATAV